MRTGILIGAVLALVAAGCSASTPEPEGVPEIVTTAAPPATSTNPPASAMTAPPATSTTDPPPSSTTTTTTTFVPLDAIDLELVEIARGFEQPVLALSPPGDDRLFVVDQPGRIWIVAGDEPALFADLRDDVVFGGERGLLGLAFAPDFATSGRLFVNYTGAGGDTRIVELQAAGDTVVDNGTVLLEIAQPARNHNGGMIAFGPDGMLWIATGDGGGANDQFGHGQRPDTLLGALLRIDVSVPGEYSVPPDNPFVAGGGAPEVWAYGLRNPWRFAFDDVLIYVADVGQNRFEELTIANATTTKGANFGWSVFEGFECFRGACDEPQLEPTLVYGHDEGCSITGGFVYRGDAVPALDGHYFFADYCGGWVRSRGPDGTVREWFETGGLITSFGQDAAGEVYVVLANGSVGRITLEEGAGG